MLSVSWPLADLTLRIPEYAFYGGLACTLASLVWWCVRLERKTKLSSRRIDADTLWVPLPRPQEEISLEINTNLEERLGVRLSPNEERYFTAFEQRTGRSLSSHPKESLTGVEMKRLLFLRFLVKKDVYNEHIS